MYQTIIDSYQTLMLKIGIIIVNNDICLFLFKDYCQPNVNQNIAVAATSIGVASIMVISLLLTTTRYIIWACIMRNKINQGEKSQLQIHENF